MGHYHTYIPEALISSVSGVEVQQSAVLKPDTATPDQSVSLSQFRLVLVDLPFPIEVRKEFVASGRVIGHSVRV